MVTRVAVVSDVHGNVAALRAVIREVQRTEADAIVCCGDIVSGPFPGETLDLLRTFDRPLYCVRGNADRGAVAAFDGTADASVHPHDIWSGRQLNREQRDFLASLPLTVTLDICGLGPVLFCHASPRRDDEIIIETTPAAQVREAAASVEAATIVCGNTHMQFDRHAGSHRWVNVGSVGMPYGEPGAYWAVLGPDVGMRHTAYDLHAAADEIRERSTWPEADEFATGYVLAPPSRQAALRSFTELARHAGVRPVGSGSEIQPIDVVAELSDHIRKCYLEPARVESLLAELASRSAEYDAFSSEDLAEKLTADLQELSGDRHFRLSATPLKDARAAVEERYKQFLPGADQNFGFRRVEVLDGNLGHLQLTTLAPPQDAGDTLRAAMELLRHVDGLMLDLRENRGGSPEMVVAIASYMLGLEPVELSGVTWHHTGERERFFSDPATAVFQFDPSLPVAILVGAGTGSAAEALAYDLQSLGRGRVIGEPTLGAAHRVVQYDIVGRFTLTVPAGRVTNPTTGSDWEGTGVVPDVAVPSSEALSTARRILTASLEGAG